MNLKQFYKRGLHSAKKGNYEAALEDFDRILQVNPADAKAYNNRGLVYYYMKDYQKAIADLSQALDINPNLFEAYLNRGNAWRHPLAAQNIVLHAPDDERAEQEPQEDGAVLPVPFKEPESV